MTRCWRLTLAALLVMVSAASALQTTVMPRPELPFFDWNACPFEGCVYGQWTAEQAIPLYDSWKKTRKRSGELQRGDKVIAVTGVVITYKPGRVRMDRDLPLSELEQDDPLPKGDLRQGEILLTFADRGEGFAAVCFRGIYYPAFDISFAKWPDGQGCAGGHCAATYVDMGTKEWWVQVKLKSGRTAWVNMDQAQFSGIDSLG